MEISKVDEEKSPMETIIKPIISSLKVSSNHPDNVTFLAVLWWYFLVIANIVIMILSLVHLQHCNKIDEIGDTVINISSESQLTFSIIFFRYHKQILVEITGIMKKRFWFNPHNVDQKILAKHKLFYRILSNIGRIYKITCSIALLSWLFEPLVTSSRKFPMDMSFPYNNFIKETPYYEIAYFLQFVTIYMSGFHAALISDIFYIDAVGFCLIQVDLLKQRIKRIISEEDAEKDIYEKLKKCVIHHNVILLSLEKINSMYKNFMLNKLLCDILVLCCVMYLFAKEMNLNIKLIFMLAAFSTQPLIYCFFGDFVTSECESIGEEAYNINWEDWNNKSLRTGLAMVIMHTQRQVLMTAGGMVVLSLPNYVAFMKMMFSFYVLMKRMDVK